MRIRWDEVDDMGGGSRPFLGFTALTWGMAVPVAFIAGAAVMSYFDQAPPTPQPVPAPVTNQNAAKSGNENRLAAEKNRWEAEAKGAAAQAAELQMQVEALRDQVNDESGRRKAAELTAAQKAAELERMLQSQPLASSRPSTAPEVAIAPPPQPIHTSAPVAVPPAFASANELNGQVQPSVLSASQSVRDVPSNNEALTLQQIVEDAASRSAALSGPNDDFEVASTSNAGTERPGKTPRRDTEVDAALTRAAGLEGLSTSARNELKAELVAGECVAVSLEKTLGTPVPAVALRNLVRDLNSNC